MKHAIEHVLGRRHRLPADLRRFLGGINERLAYLGVIGEAPDSTTASNAFWTEIKTDDPGPGGNARGHLPSMELEDRVDAILEAMRAADDE